MRDNAVLYGDTLHGSKVINEWGLRFGSSYLIKGRGWQPYSLCIGYDIYGLFRHIALFGCLAEIASVV